MLTWLAPCIMYNRNYTWYYYFLFFYLIILFVYLFELRAAFARSSSAALSAIMPAGWWCDASYYSII